MSLCVRVNKDKMVVCKTALNVIRWWYCCCRICIRQWQRIMAFQCGVHI